MKLEERFSQTIFTIVKRVINEPAVKPGNLRNSELFDRVCGPFAGRNLLTDFFERAR